MRQTVLLSHLISDFLKNRVRSRLGSNPTITLVEVASRNPHHQID
jgi:hypothetical protein